ncbi:MAG TPA: selenide, water dikinase SelD [Oligoflexia bacterium]|nr:selenide, water dikinase SelD [Oligoflexia bacterium]HMP47480.1 selenide, water dikinase SelD [Oligoflexia bacterium]
MTIKLTQYSHGAGCGCKISKKVLSEIILYSSDNLDQRQFPSLLVGNENYDDAAVLDLGDGNALISTTDFFMPIVDDPFTFGKIAAANAISDIYAMGGSPLMAIAILAWPIDKIPVEFARAVLEGGKSICHEAGIPLAGGHSIDSPEPIFGLAVSGKCRISEIKRNNSGKEGDLLYLTKPLGVGILSTAQKKGKLREEHSSFAIDTMVRLNSIGEKLASCSFVNAMTDVTGFGLLGHLAEVCEGSSLGADISLSSVPFIDKAVLESYIKEGCIPGGTNRNFESIHNKIGPVSDIVKALLCDPQTSGGLLISVDSEFKTDFEKILDLNKTPVFCIGKLVRKKEFLISVNTG